MSDAPACNMRDRAHPLFDLDSLELNKCHSFEVNTALNEFELVHPGISHRWETWPPAVQDRIAKPLNEWLARDPSRAIRLTSFGLHQGVAVVIVHYQHKAKASA